MPFIPLNIASSLHIACKSPRMQFLRTRFSYAKIYFTRIEHTAGWRSGSAGALQAQGHRFKSCTGHQKRQWPGAKASGHFSIRSGYKEKVRGPSRYGRTGRSASQATRLHKARARLPASLDRTAIAKRAIRRTRMGKLALSHERADHLIPSISRA